MVMTQAHKDAISRGVKKYHANCKAKQPAKPAKPVKKAVKKAVAKPVKKSVKKPVKEFKTPKKGEIFKDNIKSPPPKKKLTEAEIQKLEAKNMRKKKYNN